MRGWLTVIEITMYAAPSSAHLAAPQKHLDEVFVTINGEAVFGYAVGLHNCPIRRGRSDDHGRIDPASMAVTTEAARSK